MRQTVTFLLLMAAVSSANPLLAASKKPIWAKAAISLNPGCDRVPATPQSIPSPDGRVRVSVLCRTPKNSEDPVLFLRVILPNGSPHDVGLDSGANELLWAPDSKAFLVNGGESAYAGFFVSVYRIKNDDVTKLNVTGAAQRDMVTSFPPCKAENRDEAMCKEIEKDPQFNMSGLGWSEGSSAVVVMAEVPCSSSYGGIMCQVLGYELDAVTGNIHHRMTARELKERWQHDMAWQLRIPDPPIYGVLHHQH